MDGVGLAVTVLIFLMQGVSFQFYGVASITVEGIEGSCIIVPCYVSSPRNVECNGSGWLNATGDEVPNARRLSNIGTRKTVLKENCTTEFTSLTTKQSGVYSFYLDCQNGRNYVNNVSIVVHAETIRPRLNPVYLVSEGDQIRLRCFVLVPCSTLPPSITWLPRDPSNREETKTEQSGDEQMMMTSTLTFRATADHHQQDVSCSVSYPLTGGGSSPPSTARNTLRVLYAPRNVVATHSASGTPVLEGRGVTFTCQSDANPPTSRYTWYRTDDDKLTKKGVGDTLVLVARPRDSAVYLCEAKNNKGSRMSRPLALEVQPIADKCNVALPYTMLGLLFVLYILTIAADIYKYQSVSRRLERMEQIGQTTYADLRTRNITPDYDQLQPQQPTTTRPSGLPNYENL